MTGSGGYAALSWAENAANRINLGGESAARDMMGYGRDRLRAFNQDLKRLRSRLRASRMYPPAYPVHSKSTDWGP